MDTPPNAPHAAALRLILAQAHGECERSTTGIGSCWANNRTADAQYGIDQACPACIAAAALAGDDIPLGAGRHATPDTDRP